MFEISISMDLRREKTFEKKVVEPMTINAAGWRVGFLNIYAQTRMAIKNLYFSHLILAAWQ